MNSDRNDKLQQINAMVENLKNQINKYNQYILKLKKLQSELAECKKEDDSETKTTRMKRLHEELHDLHEGFNEAQIKNLEQAIKNKTIEIEKLDVELLGESHPSPGSPSFLMPRKF